MNVCIYEMSLQEMKETNGGGALDILINTIVDVLMDIMIQLNINCYS